MSNFKRPITPSLFAIAITIALAACSSSGNDAGPQGPTIAPADPQPATNTTISVLSIGATNNFTAVDQTYEVAGAFINIQENAAGGLDFTGSSRTGFQEPAGTVFYNADARSLTFNFEQGGINIMNETFGPLLLAAPGDFASLENDRTAIVIASQPNDFSFIPGGVVLPNNATSFEDFRNDPETIDDVLNDLIRIASGEPSNFGSTITQEEASLYLETLNATAEGILSADFFRLIGSDGNVFFPFKTRGNNPGIETSYVVLGAWATAPEFAAPQQYSRGATVFGALTPANEVPSSGTASYDTTIAGYVLRNQQEEFLTGSVNMDVDFDSRLIDFNVNTVLATDNPDGSTLFTPFVNLAGDGLITGGPRFEGTLIGTDDISLRGAVEGAFFGPGAVEVGGTLTFGNGEIEAAGAFVGTRLGDMAN